MTTPPIFSCIKSETTNNGSIHSSFLLGPLTIDTSVTFATILRRSLLHLKSSLFIVSAEIEGATHEYCSLPGVKESILEILLNLGELVLTAENSHFYSDSFQAYFLKTSRKMQTTFYASLRASGPVTIRAKNIQWPAPICCLKPDSHIATLSFNGNLAMRIKICYSPEISETEKFNKSDFISRLNKVELYKENYLTDTYIKALLKKENYYQRLQNPYDAIKKEEDAIKKAENEKLLEKEKLKEKIESRNKIIYSLLENSPNKKVENVSKEKKSRPKLELGTWPKNTFLCKDDMMNQGLFKGFNRKVETGLYNKHLFFKLYKESDKKNNLFSDYIFTLPKKKFEPKIIDLNPKPFSKNKTPFLSEDDIDGILNKFFEKAKKDPKNDPEKLKNHKLKLLNIFPLNLFFKNDHSKFLDEHKYNSVNFFKKTEKPLSLWAKKKNFSFEPFLKENLSFPFQRNNKNNLKNDILSNTFLPNINKDVEVSQFEHKDITDKNNINNFSSKDSFFLDNTTTLEDYNRFRFNNPNVIRHLSLSKEFSPYTYQDPEDTGNSKNAPDSENIPDSKKKPDSKSIPDLEELLDSEEAMDFETIMEYEEQKKKLLAAKKEKKNSKSKEPISIKPWGNPLPVKSISSPVEKVNFRIERDDQLEGYRHRIIFDIWTNGSISPKRAIYNSLNWVMQLLFTYREAIPINNLDL